MNTNREEISKAAAVAAAIAVLGNAFFPIAAVSANETNPLQAAADMGTQAKKDAENGDLMRAAGGAEKSSALLQEMHISSFKPRNGDDAQISNEGVRAEDAWEAQFLVNSPSQKGPSSVAAKVPMPGSKTMGHGDGDGNVLHGIANGAGAGSTRGFFEAAKLTGWGSYVSYCLRQQVGLTCNVPVFVTYTGITLIPGFVGWVGGGLIGAITGGIVEPIRPGSTDRWRDGEDNL